MPDVEGQFPSCEWPLRPSGWTRLGSPGCRVVSPATTFPLALPPSGPRPDILNLVSVAVGTPRLRLEAGARVGGKYRLVRRVAVGGMGEVWRARNEATGADVALKVLRGDADEVTG